MREALCSHIWVYDHKDYNFMYKRCQRCGEVRKTDYTEDMLHPFRANQVARELHIRHDGEDGDV